MIVKASPVSCTGSSLYPGVGKVRRVRRENGDVSHLVLLGYLFTLTDYEIVGVRTPEGVSTTLQRREMIGR